jgi:hypothetical protein
MTTNRTAAKAHVMSAYARIGRITLDTAMTALVIVGRSDLKSRKILANAGTT